MNRGPITVRYARGLFELGKDKNVLDRLYNDSKLLLEHFIKVRDFSAFLNSPAIKPSRKKEVLHKVMGNEQHTYMLRFMELVIDKSRETLLKDMILFFETLYKQYKGIKSVNLVTAVSLDHEYQNNLKIFLERELNAPIEMDVKVKPEILGGLILIINGKILDNSIAHQMRLIKKKLLS
jgi:F-type H+-transporting ATPase subunit delta